METFVDSFNGAESAENLNGTTIQINWNASTDKTITDFNIFTVTAEGSLSLIGSTTASTTFFLHTGLNSGRLLSYVVRAVRGNGGSRIDTNRNIVSALAYAGITSATVIDETTADLSFPAAAEASSLKVYCAVGASGAMTLRTQLAASATSYRLNGLTTRTLHSCKVKAVLPDGSEDQNSAVRNFTPDTVTSPFGFTGIATATNTDGSTALVTWVAANPAPGKTIAGYRIYQTSGDSMIPYDIFSPSTTSYQIPGLTAGTNYRFMVRAIDTNGVTDGNIIWKNVFTYAGITTANATSSTTADLYFPAAPSSAGLRVYCYTGDTPPVTPTETLAATANRYTVTGLTSATDYKCFVKAVGIDGEDGNSAVLSFRTN